MSGHDVLTGAGNITVADCTIGHGGRVYTSGMGVLFQSCWESKIVHNAIFDFFQTGISVGWSWNYVFTANHNNLVAFNRIHNIGQGLTSDMGPLHLPPRHRDGPGRDHHRGQRLLGCEVVHLWGVRDLPRPSVEQPRRRQQHSL